MDKKVVLITGGSSGLGLAIGQFLRSQGHLVYGTTRSKAKYPGFSFFPLLEMDVRNMETVQKAVKEIIGSEGRIDVLVNNAGVGINGPMEELPIAEIENVFAVNCNGPLRLIKAVLPQMRKQGTGLIINITSIAGYMGLPYRGAYSASKGALGLITEALRMEVSQYGVHVTTLAPGDFATNIAAGRFHAPVLDHSPYKDSYGAMLTHIDAAVDSGGDPTEVAKKILFIMGRKKPKVHYTVGKPLQRFSIVLKGLLPSTWFERLLSGHSKS